MVENRISEKGLNFTIVQFEDENLVLGTNFNPIKKLPIVDMIAALPAVVQVTCVEKLNDQSGSIHLNLREEATPDQLKAEILEMLNNVIV